MSFKNLSILSKTLSIVVFLSAIMTGLTGIAVNALGTMNETAQRIDDSGDESTLVSQMIGNIIAISREEFNLAANPSPENRAETAEAIAQERAIFESRLSRLQATATGEQVGFLEGIAENYSQYIAQLEETFETADRIGNSVEISQAAQTILSGVENSEVYADALRENAYAFANHTEQRGEALTEEAAEIYVALRTVLIGLSAAGIIIGLLLGFLVARYGISKPIGRIVTLLRSLAENDTAVTITDVDRSDEVGAIAKTAQVFKENIERTRRLEAEQEERERQSNERSQQAMNRLADDFESTVKGVVDTVASASNQMESSAQNLSSIAEQTNRQSVAVGAAAEEASINVETVASAAEELSGSITEINRQVTDATQAANSAVEAAKQTNTTVEGLAEAAQRIGEVVKMIQDIAEQTNLLALNATIEAARAGEAGKGFAVVASEVKNLANQTAKATDEIATQITSMQSVTGQTVEAIKDIGATIEQVNEKITGIASAAEQQGAATQEIARNVQNASTGTREVSNNIGDVTQAASETGALATQALSASGELSRQATVLSQEVDAFIGKVRDSA